MAALLVSLRQIGSRRIRPVVLVAISVIIAGGVAPQPLIAQTESGKRAAPITDQIGGGSQLRTPAPGTKNATMPIASDPRGVTRRAPAAPGTKNDDVAAPHADAPNADAGGAGWRFLACGTINDGGWTTTSAAFETIRSCTVRVPEDGVVYIDASSSMGVGSGGAYEARFNVSIDAPTGNAATDRWINAETDTGDGTDKSVAVTLLAPVTAGDHTIYFLAARYNGAGTVQLYDPSLSVLYLPGTSADLLTCGAASDTIWNTAETSFQEIRSCKLAVPQSGFVYINGTASAGIASGGGAYEARFRLGVDAVTGTASSDRWVNVVPDSGDGVDEAIATSLLTSVAAGEHTFYFSGMRYNGAGPLQVYDPTLSVLYFPAPNVTAKVCGAGGSDTWTNSTTSYLIIRSCTLNVPRNGFAFMNATASAGLNATGAGNEWEGQFRLGVDNDTGSSLFDRWINVYPDAGDGTDRSVAVSGIVNISAGVHTFYFVGRRYNGPGTLRLYSPSLTVVVPGANHFVPIFTQ